jgi:peptidoglycan hydrolase-like protein with peptidoglycan-binding domain
MGGLCDANDILQPDWGGHAPAVDPDEILAIRAAIDAAKTQVLSQGASGDAVMWAQLLLNKKLGAVLTVDGLFGPRTTWATRQFQVHLQRYFKDPGIAVDGVIGPQTWFFLDT